MMQLQTFYYIMSDIRIPSASVNDLGKPLPGAVYIITKRPHGPDTLRGRPFDSEGGGGGAGTLWK